MWHVILFELHPAITIAIVIAHGVLAIILAILSSNCLVRYFGAESIPVAPYFVSVTTLLSIVFAFIAVDTWSNSKEAGFAARQELDAFERLADVTTLVSGEVDELKNLLFVYAYEVEKTEWGTPEDRFGVVRAEQTLSGMREAATSLALGGLSGPIASEIYQSIDQLSEARRARLSIVRDTGDGYKWSLLFSLSLFTHLAVGVVHADRKRAQLVSLVIFSGAFCSAMAIMAVHDDPYRGPSAHEEPNFLAIQFR